MSLRKRTLTGLFWATVQQIGTQSIGVVISVVLARLLSPTDFGLMGMIYIFIAVSTTLINSGMGQSLIRMAKPENEDYSTVFHINILFAVIIYAALFLSAPLIAGFYGEEILKNIIRVYGLVFVFDALSSVQNTIIIRRMHFKKQLRLSLPSLALSGALGVVLAASGYGVWSLVWSGVAKSALYALQIWIYSDWRPMAVLDMGKFRYHFRFGIRLTMSELLNNVSNSIYPFVTGKFFAPAQTGYLTQASTVKQFPISTILGPINKVAYPSLANLQSDKIRLRRAFAKMERLTLAVLTPAMVFGIVLAEPILVFLLSERWIAAAPYLQIVCLAGIISIAGTYNGLILRIQGRSGTILGINVCHKIFMLLAIAAAIPFGIYALIWSQVAVSLAYYIPSSIIACRAIGYSFRKLLSGSIRILTIGAVTAAAVWAVRMAVAANTNLIQLLICIPAGLLVYAALIYIFERDIFKEAGALFAGRFIVRTGKNRRGHPDNNYTRKR